MRSSEGPRYYESKQAWYANVDKNRYLLVKGDREETKTEAFAQYVKVMATSKSLRSGDNGPVWPMLNAWLTWLRTRLEPAPVAPATLRIAKLFANSFAEYVGDVPIRDLRKSHFDGWLETKVDEGRVHKIKGHKLVWEASTRQMAIKKLRSAFNWAATDGGIIKYNPFKEQPDLLKLGKARLVYKGKRPAIETDEHEILLKDAQRRAHKDFAYLLMFLYGTGARPAELHQAKANEWDEVRKAFVMQIIPENVGRYKLLRYGEPGTIYIPDNLVPIARELMAKYPMGPIFLGMSGADPG